MTKEEKEERQRRFSATYAYMHSLGLSINMPETKQAVVKQEKTKQENSVEESRKGMIQNPLTGKWSFGII